MFTIPCAECNEPVEVDEEARKRGAPVTHGNPSDCIAKLRSAIETARREIKHWKVEWKIDRDAYEGEHRRANAYLDLLIQCWLQFASQVPDHPTWRHDSGISTLEVVRDVLVEHEALRQVREDKDWYEFVEGP